MGHAESRVAPGACGGLHDPANYDDDEINETVLVPRKVAETVSSDGVLRSVAEEDEEEEQESVWVSRKTVLAIVERLGRDEDVTNELLEELVRPQFPLNDEPLVRVDLRARGLDYESLEDMLEALGPRGTAKALVNAFRCVSLAADGDSDATFQDGCHSNRLQGMQLQQPQQRQQQRQQEVFRSQRESAGASWAETKEEEASQWNEIVEDEVPIGPDGQRLYNSQLSVHGEMPNMTNSTRVVKRGEDRTASVRCAVCPGSRSPSCKFP